MRTVRLGDLCSIQSGGTPLRKETLSFGGVIPWAKIGDLEATDGVVHRTEESLTEAGLRAIGGRIFPSGTVLLAMYGSIGKVAVAGTALATNQAILGIQVVDPDVLSPEYLRRWLEFIRRELVFAARGVTQQNISATLVRGLQIPLPAVAEQRRIAAVLDRADAVQRNQRERMRLLDEFLRSAFREMFDDPINHLRIRGLPAGWELVTVESIAARTTNACAGGPFGSSLTRADYIATAGVPVIRGTNLVADRAVFREEGFVFVTAEKAKELRRNVARPGDIVFTQRGTLGQVARIPLEAKYPRYIVSQSQMKVTLDETVVDPTYLVHYFLSTHARADLEARTLTTGVPHINLSILKRFPVVLPPLALQRRFAALASRFTICRRHMESARSDADKLANSLTQRAFGGDRTNVSHSIVIPLKTEA